ncbi:MFS transporter [Sphingobacterium sp. SGG-5]|uniref:MFS transporter n=1 Tax=Sphingobacterium sp. SGG-5 TaxID=2710881 RepID=UPI0013ECF052|nr:MFS transporter [Sphingobacterium sp. SGG-5]NGM61790.1 MFS transporter [Sphingobacterium sp. SGG-5]
MQYREKTSGYAWVVVGLLWVVALLNYMDRQILSTLRPAMQIDIAELESARVFGNLMAVFLWIYAFMSPVSGLISDRFNRKHVIVFSLFVWSAVTLLMGFSTNLTELMILRSVMGVSEAMYIPAALALIADYHSDRTRSLAIGIHMTGLYMGQALGGFGGTIAEDHSWHVVFKVFGLVGVVYAFVLLLALKEVPNRFKSTIADTAPRNNSSIFRVLGLLFSNISFWVILFYFAIPSLPGWATKNWLPTLFAENLHLPMSTAGPLSTITIAASSFIGVILGGILSDKWVIKNIRGRIYTSAIGLLLTVPSILLIGFSHQVWAIVGAGILFGIGFGMFDANNMPILCQFVNKEHRATAYGIMNFVGVLSGALITNILGASAEQGDLGNDFALLAFIVLFVIIVQLLTLKPKTREI